MNLRPFATKIGKHSYEFNPTALLMVMAFGWFFGFAMGYFINGSF